MAIRPHADLTASSTPSRSSLRHDVCYSRCGVVYVYRYLEDQVSFGGGVRV